MKEEPLLRRLQAKEPEALESLMAQYHRYIYTLIYNILGPAGKPSDAEELTNDTFFAVWFHADAIHPGKLKAYLCTTARNKAKSFLRRTREVPMDLDTVELPDRSDTLDETLIRQERAALVRQAIAKMRPKDREIFLRYYYYLQPTEQIAACMSIPHGTVRSRLSRGRKLLKTMLSKEVSL